MYSQKNQVKGQKNVAVLSISYPLHGKTTDNDKNKPRIIKLFDCTKRGTDIVDQLNGHQCNNEIK